MIDNRRNQNGDEGTTGGGTPTGGGSMGQQRGQKGGQTTNTGSMNQYQDETADFEQGTEEKDM